MIDVLKSVLNDTPERSETDQEVWRGGLASHASCDHRVHKSLRIGAPTGGNGVIPSVCVTVRPAKAYIPLTPQHAKAHA